MPSTKSIRLLLTITPDKLPEWHACLESIDNGYVRAEFVRKALKKIHPKEIQIMNQAEAVAPEPSNSALPSPAAPAVRPPDLRPVEAEKSAAPTPSTGDGMASKDGLPEIAEIAIAQDQADIPQMSTGPEGADVREVGLIKKVFMGKDVNGWG